MCPPSLCLKTRHAQTEEKLVYTDLIRSVADVGFPHRDFRVILFVIIFSRLLIVTTFVQIVNFL